MKFRKEKGLLNVLVAVSLLLRAAKVALRVVVVVVVGSVITRVTLGHSGRAIEISSV